MLYSDRDREQISTRTCYLHFYLITLLCTDVHVDLKQVLNLEHVLQCSQTHAMQAQSKQCWHTKKAVLHATPAETHVSSQEIYEE